METYVILRRERLAHGRRAPGGSRAFDRGGRSNAGRGRLDPQLRPHRARRNGRHGLHLPWPRARRRSAAMRRQPSYRSTRSSPSPTWSSCRPIPHRSQPRDERRRRQCSNAHCSHSLRSCRYWQLAGLATANSGVHQQLRDVERATSQFRDVANAEAAGYAELLDAEQIACIDMPGVGGMGIHYVNGALVSDTVIDPLTPEAMVYAPARGDRLKLVAVEYIVFAGPWDAEHDRSAVALRSRVRPDAGRQPVRAGSVLRAPRVDLQAESRRSLHPVESQGDLPNVTCPVE